MSSMERILGALCLVALILICCLIWKSNRLEAELDAVYDKAAALTVERDALKQQLDAYQVAIKEQEAAYEQARKLHDERMRMLSNLPCDWTDALLPADVVRMLFPEAGAACARGGDTTGAAGAGDGRANVDATN